MARRSRAGRCSCWPSRRAAGAGRRGAGAAARAERRPPTRSSTAARRPSRRPSASSDDFGDEAVWCWCGASCAQHAAHRGPRAGCCALEGCLSGNVPDTKKGLGNLPPVCREIAELEAGQGRVRPGDVHQHAGQPDRRRVRAAPGGQPAPGAGARPQAARRLSKRRGDPPAEQERLASAAVEAVTAQFTQQVIQLALRYGHHRHPAHRRPRLRLGARVRLGRRSGCPKSRFAYLFPSRERRDDHDPAASPDLSDARAPPRDRPVREATEQRVFRPRDGASYVVTGVPVVSRGPGRRGAELDLRAARRGAAADGGHAGARLPHAAAAAAAGARAGRRGDDVRRPVAGGRQPDDGLDRGAAGADRPGGGLRDPVPGPLRRAAQRARGPAGGAPSGGGRGRRGARRRARRSSPPASPPPSASSCCCCRRCRWCAASAPCSCSGIGLALACALCAGFAALVRFGGAARPRRADGAAARCARGSRAVRRHPRVDERPRVARRPLLAHARRALCRGRSRVLGDRPGGGGGRPGARHPERGRLRRARARARRTCRRSRT